MPRAPHLYAVESVAMATTIRVPAPWRPALAGFDAELRAANRSTSTRRMRDYQLRRFASAHAHLAPEQITRQHLVDWLGSRDWKPETRRSYRAALVVWFRWMSRTGHIDHDPAAALPAIVVPRALPRPAPDDALIAGLAGSPARVQLAIEIIDAAGLRRAECAALHTSHLVTAVDGAALRIVGKGGHERIVPVPERIAHRIRAADGYVFPGQIQGHLSAAYLGKLISEELPGDWTAHTLRHRYATRVYAATRDLRVVQELLGHADPRTTARYVGVSLDRLRLAAASAWDLPRAA